MPDDDTVFHDAERLRDRAKQARAMAHKRKDGGTKQILMALAENFERLAELATEEQAELT
jgi:hypothetical protein